MRDDGAVADELDCAGAGRRVDEADDAEGGEIDDRQPRFVVASHEGVRSARRRGQRCAHGERRSSGERDECAAIHEGGTGVLAPKVPLGSLER